ncbi:nucleotide exchange factor GrpE [Nocardioides ultimimeridianus]
MTEGSQPDPTPAPEGAGVEVPASDTDISGIDNLLEEGGPLEPQDVAEVEQADEPLAAAESKVSELTLDLQRLQAEYLNYKRRVERDRELIKENATYAALAPIVEVLDTIDRAREHEPLEGGFKAVAEQLERVVAGVGLVKFGEPGEPFDPTLHEALSHLGADADVQVTTIKLVAKAGYKIGDRVVRAAQVLVVDPE